MNKKILSSEIISRFNQCMDSAVAAGEPEPTAMVLATSDGRGGVTTRTVLLKSLDESGFVFYTNTQSVKGQQLHTNPRAAVTFLWKASLCQVHVTGAVEQVSAQDADEYFASRDRGSQIGAWASLQSRELDSRETLEQKVRDFEQKFEGRDVPRPLHWTGFRILPDVVEFWHGRAFRLHDRFKYSGQGDQWKLRRLYP